MLFINIDLYMQLLIQNLTHFSYELDFRFPLKYRATATTLRRSENICVIFIIFAANRRNRPSRGPTSLLLYIVNKILAVSRRSAPPEYVPSFVHFNTILVCRDVTQNLNLN